MSAERYPLGMLQLDLIQKSNEEAAMTTTTEDVAQVVGMPRIGDPAPSFTAESTQGPINCPGDYSG